MNLRRIVKIGLRVVAGALVGAGIIWALSLYRQGAFDPFAIRDAIARNRFAPPIFIGLQILASLLWVPRTVLGIAAGLLFGLLWGTIWAILGAVAGAAAGRAFVKWMGAGALGLEATPRLGPLIARAERGGWWAVAIVRLIPGIPHSAANTAFALTRISWPDYLLGSFVGMLPMTLVQVDIGAAGGHALRGESGWIVAGLLLTVGVTAWFLLKWIVPRQD